MVISSEKSSNPNSPTVEYFRRLRGYQFEMLYSEDTLLEYILKLKELGITDDRTLVSRKISGSFFNFTLSSEISPVFMRNLANSSP